MEHKEQKPETNNPRNKNITSNQTYDLRLDVKEQNTETHEHNKKP
jgi:hypothetical protein